MRKHPFSHDLFEDCKRILQLTIICVKNMRRVSHYVIIDLRKIYVDFI